MTPHAEMMSWFCVNYCEKLWVGVQSAFKHDLVIIIFSTLILSESSHEPKLDASYMFCPYVICLIML